MVDGHYAMLRPEFEDLKKDEYLKMDLETLMSFLCFVAYECLHGKRVIVVSPHYTRIDGNNDATENAWGNLANFQIAIVPVCFVDHYGIVLYERGQRALYYDPLPHPGRLTGAMEYRFRCALSQLDPAISKNNVIIDMAARCSWRAT